MTDFQSVAQQFTQYYYSTFDENRSNLAALYVRETSESIRSQELEANCTILERPMELIQRDTTARAIHAHLRKRLRTRDFRDSTKACVKHVVSTLDAQPSNQTPEGGILVMVTGALMVDEEERPMNYTQVFQLLRDGQGSYFVFNDIFKLIYG
ncbi:MAG: hypothetical protein Q9209_005181 [Squamulea sp. 1 TL-2023]